jgi:hypothetical protein
MEVEDRVRESQGYREARRNAAATDRADTIQPRTLNRIAIIGAIALGAFLLGLIPMWLASKGYENELAALTKTLRPSVLQNNLATATINAQRGEFEHARQQTSSFFSDLRGELERSESSFVREQHEAVNAILEQRDDTITLLARSDPASAERLTDLYFNFIQVKNSAVPEKK